MEQRSQGEERESIFNNNHHLHLQHHQFNLQQKKPFEATDLDTDPDPPPVTTGSNSKPPPSELLQPTPPPQPAAVTSIRYRECLKNHAASMGGHVVDGCGEFMPTGEEGTPEYLKCAACDCHRNFHRKEIDGESTYNPNSYSHPNKNRHGKRNTIPPPPPPPPHHRQQHPVMMMAFGNNGGVPAAEYSSSEDLNLYHSNNVGVVQPLPPRRQHPMTPSSSKKRFRTKFTREQKEKMMELAEKLGWKIQKQDEEEVDKFCSEIGIKRQVFKVWMHNNKQALKKLQDIL